MLDAELTFVVPSFFVPFVTAFQYASPTPPKRRKASNKSPPHKGNPPRRFGLGLGSQRLNYLSLSYRPGVHDLQEKVEGYLQYSQITILDTKINLYEHGYIAIEKFNLITLQKLSSYEFITPNLSWGFDISLKSNSGSKCLSCYYLAINPNIGFGNSFNKILHMYILLDSKFNHGNIKNNNEFDQGIKLLSIVDFKNIKSINAIRPSYSSLYKFVIKLNSQLVLNINNQHTFKLSASYSKLNSRKKQISGETSLYIYF